MKTRKKYLVIGDWIQSKHDGQQHFVSAEELVKLYSVDRRECILFNHDVSPRNINVSGLIILGPRFNGDYQEYLNALRN